MTASREESQLVGKSTRRSVRGRVLCAWGRHVPGPREVILGFLETGLGNRCTRCRRVLTYIPREHPGYDGFPDQFGTVEEVRQ